MWDVCSSIQLITEHFHAKQAPSVWQGRCKRPGLRWGWGFAEEELEFDEWRKFEMKIRMAEWGTFKRPVLWTWAGYLDLATFFCMDKLGVKSAHTYFTDDSTTATFSEFCSSCIPLFKQHSHTNKHTCTTCTVQNQLVKISYKICSL